jgi:hypothetical protein
LGQFQILAPFTLVELDGSIEEDFMPENRNVESEKFSVSAELERMIRSLAHRHGLPEVIFLKELLAYFSEGEMHWNRVRERIGHRMQQMGLENREKLISCIKAWREESANRES